MSDFHPILPIFARFLVVYEMGWGSGDNKEVTDSGCELAFHREYVALRLRTTTGAEPSDADIDRSVLQMYASRIDFGANAQLVGLRVSDDNARAFHAFVVYDLRGPAMRVTMPDRPAIARCRAQLASPPTHWRVRECVLTGSGARVDEIARALAGLCRPGMTMDTIEFVRKHAARDLGVDGSILSIEPKRASQGSYTIVLFGATRNDTTELAAMPDAMMEERGARVTRVPADVDETVADLVAQSTTPGVRPAGPCTVYVIPAKWADAAQEPAPRRSAAKRRAAARKK